MLFHPDDSDNWSECNDKELWQALQKGNRRAFSELFSRFYPRLFRYGISLVSDREAVKDGIQELFLSLWKHRKELGDAESVEFYLLFSFRRALFKEKKQLSNREKRNWKYSEDLLKYEISIENQIIHIETIEKRQEVYQKALKALSEQQRESLRLRIEYGLDNREIAKVMDVSEKRVRNLIYETTRKLREWISFSEPFEVNLN